MIGFREALAPDVISAEDASDITLLVRFRAHVKDERPGPVQTDGVRQEGNPVARHGPGGDVLIGLRKPAPTVCLRPGHTHVAGFVNLSLPVPQKLELLIGADLHEGLG